MLGREIFYAFQEKICGKRAVMEQGKEIPRTGGRRGGEGDYHGDNPEKDRNRDKTTVKRQKRGRADS